MAKTQPTATQDETRRLLFEAPIAELAESRGISVDEAVKLRVDETLKKALPVEVTDHDFKVVNGKNGIFLGAPSKPDPGSRTGYRTTARITDRALQERLNEKAVEAYSAAVEKLVARAEAVRPAPIRQQMEKAARAADKENTARTEPGKKKEARDDR